MDITKLPKWAQIHIKRLERDLESLKSQITDMSDGEETELSWTANYDDWYGIPEGSTVRLIMSNGDHLELYKDSQGVTTIRVGGILVINPQAANVVRISSQSDWEWS